MLRAQGSKRLDWNSRGAWKAEGEAKHPATKWAATEKLMASVWGMQQEHRQLSWEEMRAMPGRNYLNPAILSGSSSICPLNPESSSHTALITECLQQTQEEKRVVRGSKKTRNWMNKEWHNLVSYDRIYECHLSRQGKKICWSGQPATSQKSTFQFAHVLFISAWLEKSTGLATFARKL